MKKLEEKLLLRKKSGTLRQLHYTELAIDFFSNDYLGLARNETLRDEIYKDYTSFTDLHRQNGSTGSRLLSGNNGIYQETENFLSGIFNSEKTLLFNSGYNANLSILSCVPQKGDTILYDELIHASVKDGARLSFAKRFSFRHNDLEDLTAKLNKSEGEKFVVVESVYSMDGDFSPLKELADLCEKYAAHLIVDEAHSTGIWGSKGSGLICHLGIENKIFARIYTFGKAMGIHGACIAGSETLINYLINYARPFIYTTALPLHSIAGVRAAFRFIAADEKPLKALHNNIALFKNGITGNLSKENNLQFIESSSAIQVLKVPGIHRAKTLSENIRKKGIDMRAILSPTVKEGEERLRICLHAFNSPDEIKYLTTILTESQVELFS